MIPPDSVKKGRGKGEREEGVASWLSGDGRHCSAVMTGLESSRNDGGKAADKDAATGQPTTIGNTQNNRRKTTGEM